MERGVASWRDACAACPAFTLFASNSAATMSLNINPEAMTWSIDDNLDMEDKREGMFDAASKFGFMMVGIFLAVVLIEVVVVVLLMRLTMPKPSKDKARTLIVLGSGVCAAAAPAPHACRGPAW